MYVYIYICIYIYYNIQIIYIYIYMRISTNQNTSAGIRPAIYIYSCVFEAAWNPGCWPTWSGNPPWGPMASLDLEKHRLDDGDLRPGHLDSLATFSVDITINGHFRTLKRGTVWYYCPHFLWIFPEIELQNRPYIW